MPVFIVGKPRSGTTLVEQIIASHSQCLGRGELNLIQSICGDDVEFAIANVQVKAVELDDECVFLICEAAEYPVKFRLTPDESVKFIAVEKSVP